MEVDAPWDSRFACWNFLKSISALLSRFSKKNENSSKLFISLILNSWGLKIWFGASGATVGTDSSKLLEIDFNSSNCWIVLCLTCLPAQYFGLRLQSLLGVGCDMRKGKGFFVKLKLSAKEHKSASYGIVLLLKSIKGNSYTKNKLREVIWNKIDVRNLFILLKSIKA